MSANYWRGKHVLVTGGSGFIGRHVIHALVERGASRDYIRTPGSQDDLRIFSHCKRLVGSCHVVIHLAAATGGIQYSKAHPASQYHDCMLMNLNMLNAVMQKGVAKFVGLGNILAYPANAPSPLEEESLFDGKIAPTHLGIGMAKRDMVVMCEMHYKEYGTNAITVLSANAYGTGDRFDPELAHVIPSTIIKCHQSGPLVVWGDGKPTRDFLYVKDVAIGVAQAAELLNAPNYHINLSSGEEISIGDLVRKIAKLCDFRGDIVFDESKSGGDMRRCASNKMARELLGFHPEVGLEAGLMSTIAWYRKNVLCGYDPWAR